MFWLKSLFKGKKSANLEPNERIIKLERIIGYPIDNPSLFLKALRHRSTLSQEQYATYDSYERLEFLGDSVLDLIIAEILFNKYPKKDRKSTRLNSSHVRISYAVFCLKKKKKT